MNVHGEVQLTGSNAADGTTGVAVSFELDDNGRPVLRIVDAAPAAYDKLTDRLRTSRAGIEIITLVDNLALRDASTKSVSTPTLNYVNKDIIVESTLDAVVNIFPVLKHGIQTRFWNGTTWASAQVTIPSGGNSGAQHLVSSQFSWISQPSPVLGVVYLAATVPTTGNITIKVLGELA